MAEMTSFMEFMIYVRTLTHPMAFPFQEEMHLVLQYADGGDLRSLVAKKGPFPDDTAITRLAILTMKQINITVSANHRPAQCFEMDWSHITD